MMTPHEKITLITSLEKALHEAQKIPTRTACYDCGFWQSGKCLKWREMIPKETVPVGCDEFVFNNLTPPF